MSLTLHLDEHSAPIVFASTQTNQEHICLADGPPRISRNSNIAIYLVHAGPAGTPLNKLRWEKQFVLKIGRTPDQISLLLAEANVYTNALQGFPYAPEFHGLFSGFVGPAKAVCLMLEWCGGGCLMSQDELNRQIILATCALHKAKVLHGRLGRDSPQHIIPVGKTVKIIDYTGAIWPHACPNAVPLTYSNMPTYYGQCPELNLTEMSYGDTSDLASPFEAAFAQPQAVFRPSLSVLSRRVVPTLAFL
ncbi:hypothetical protein C8F01DRAFT_1244274 [Mycena amicta]|nr:hypothetical protein C8F01DRAFT_1244274 [Mycena amicta]